MELINRLTERYGYNEPIFAEEILAAWNEYSRTRVFQLLKKFVNDKLILKFDMGVYYVPTKTFLGTLSYLNVRKVIEKRYIKSNGEVFGYYGGLNLLNLLGFTRQMSNAYEVITTKETTRVRRITVGNFNVILRRARVPINKDNVYVMQLLEAFNIEKNAPDEIAISKVGEFIREKGLKLEDIYLNSNIYPKKALRNLESSGVLNVFAQ